MPSTSASSACRPTARGSRTLDEARLFEIDDNLAGAELSAVELVVFMAERKRVHQRLHPETAQGRAGAVARWTPMQEREMSFASAIAEKRGLSVRQAQRLIAIGEKLDPEAASRSTSRWRAAGPRSPPRRRDAETPIDVSGLRAGVDGRWIAETVEHRLSAGGLVTRLRLVPPPEDPA